MVIALVTSNVLVVLAKAIPYLPIYLFWQYKMLFIQVRNCKEISGIEIFGYEFKLSTFADDATYFILNEHSIQQLATLFSKFEEYSSLKLKADKTDVCGIGSKKRGNTGTLMV